MSKQTINSLPESDADFISDLETFIRDEIVNRNQLQGTPASVILSGGIGATDASLTHTISACVGFSDSYYVAQDSISHTYTATKDTYVYLRDDDSRVIAITGYTITYDSNLVFAEYDSGVGSTRPSTPNGCLPLFLAVSNGTSITSITDYRQITTLIDPLESDQGVTATGSGRTLYDISQDLTANTTAIIGYQRDIILDTSIDLSSFLNLKLSPLHGAKIVQVTGDETITLHSPSNLDASPTQQVTEDDCLRFSRFGTVYPFWWGPATINQGSVDSTLAIRYSISSLSSTYGGKIQFAAGTYKAYPQSAGTSDHVLTLNKSNVEISGAGLLATKISCYALNGADPDANYEIISAEVWRGYGIYMPGGETAETALKNIYLHDFELAGNCSYDGPYATTDLPIYPADTGDGTGWDITHRAIYGNIEGVGAGYYDNIRFERLHIHGWKGELIGASVTFDASISRIFVKDCRLYDTNGNCYSFNGQNLVESNEMYNCTMGVEDSYRKAPSVYNKNYIHDAGLHCMAFSNGGEGEPYGPVQVINNIIKSCPENGIWIGDATNMVIDNNTIIDCGQSSGFYGLVVYHSDERVENVQVTKNRIIYHEADGNIGISIDVGTTYEATGVLVEDNVVKLTKYASDEAKTLYQPYYFSGDFGSDCLIKNNETLEYGQTSDTVIEELLTTTDDTLILSKIPDLVGFYAVDIYYRIITAATDITIGVYTLDFDTQAAFVIPVDEVAQAAGTYIIPSVIVPNNAANLIQIYAQAGTANQIYISTQIRKV